MASTCWYAHPQRQFSSRIFKPSPCTHFICSFLPLDSSLRCTSLSPLSSPLFSALHSTLPPVSQYTHPHTCTCIHTHSHSLSQDQCSWVILRHLSGSYFCSSVPSVAESSCAPILLCLPSLNIMADLGYSSPSPNQSWIHPYSKRNNLQTRRMLCLPECLTISWCGQERAAWVGTFHRGGN